MQSHFVTHATLAKLKLQLAKQRHISLYTCSLLQIQQPITQFEVTVNILEVCRQLRNQHIQCQIIEHIHTILAKHAPPSQCIVTQITYKKLTRLPFIP